ncbi:hypothetical protein RUM43_005478 [Polyplax serrata]|uniref:Cilia- and flagella-associated protein 299 n=1 Tax=Polyplax serrata TaxID=468196 RepID=A0AAN8NQ93_POLSC
MLEFKSKKKTSEKMLISLTFPDWLTISSYNVLCLISSPQTIIYIKYVTNDGHEISGYIDYADRLLNENWTPFFLGKKKLKLRTTDLAFFNWRNKKAIHNDSANFLSLEASRPLHVLLWYVTRHR